MRTSKKAAILLALAATIGAVQASGKQNTLRISMTVIDRCDIRQGQANPSVDCSVGVPWMVVTPTASAPSLVADGHHAAHLPVPLSGVVDGARVTTIVF